MDDHVGFDASISIRTSTIVTDGIQSFINNNYDNYNNNKLDNVNNNNNNNGNMAVTIDILTMALLISSILYIFCLILAKRKLSEFNRLHHSANSSSSSQPTTTERLSTKKLLILSLLLVSIVRVMTIWGVAAMNVANVRAHYSLQPPNNNHNNDHNSSSHQLFYDKAMTVLFDLPNCMVVSTYVLLTLVWAECFVEARLHTESATSLKTTWLIYFMIFNTLLYVTQLTLYGSVLLLPPTFGIVRTIIYVGITGINFTAVLLVLIFYIYLNIRFSGFPYRSDRLRASLSRVSSVMTLWSFTRIIWGIATLYVYMYNIELLQDSNTPFWSFVVLILLFLVCEILPIIALLDYSYLNTFFMIGNNNIGNNNNNNNSVYYSSEREREQQQQQWQLQQALLLPSSSRRRTRSQEAYEENDGDEEEEEYRTRDEVENGEDGNHNNGNTTTTSNRERTSSGNTAGTLDPLLSFPTSTSTTSTSRNHNNNNNSNNNTTTSPSRSIRWQDESS